MTLIEEINQALSLYAEGNKEIAYKKLLKIFKKNNGDNKLRYNIAVIQQDLRIYSEARKNYEYLIKYEKNIKAIINLYNIDIIEEKYEDALGLINLVIKEEYNEDSIFCDQAFVYFKLKNYSKSIQICKNFIKKSIIKEQFLNVLGLNYFAENNYAEAESIFKKILEHNPNDIGTLNSLGSLYHEIRKFDESEKYFISAYKLNENSYEVINNLAGLYREDSQYNKSIALYKKSLILYPKSPKVLNNLAKCYFDINKLDLAEKFSKKALNLDSKDGNIRKIIALIYLRKQNYRDGWRYFDGRLNLSEFESKNKSIVNFKSKLKTNNLVKRESNILIIREQGIGDEILYGTMYKDFLNKFNSVTIECDVRLKKLFQENFKGYESRFVELGTYSKNITKLKTFDDIIFAGSLGKFVRNSKMDFNGGSYLEADKDLVKKMEKNIKTNKGRFKIGLSWKSFKNRYSEEKSLSLDNLLNILKSDNCDFFNLQYGNVSNEIKDFKNRNKIEINTIKNLDIFNDIDNLSALLENLDLLITVSNSTAHLAGALGVKTLLIKPMNHALFHYWNQPSNKTPWYDSVILADKQDVINEIDLIQKYLNL